jgi:hypothetical protein
VVVLLPRFPFVKGCPKQCIIFQVSLWFR